MRARCVLLLLSPLLLLRSAAGLDLPVGCVATLAGKFGGGPGFAGDGGPASEALFNINESLARVVAFVVIAVVGIGFPFAILARLWNVPARTMRDPGFQKVWSPIYGGYRSKAMPAHATIAAAPLHAPRSAEIEKGGTSTPTVVSDSQPLVVVARLPIVISERKEGPQGEGEADGWGDEADAAPVSTRKSHTQLSSTQRVDNSPTRLVFGPSLPVLLLRHPRAQRQRQRSLGA